jgi:carboxylesterase type B
MKIDVPALFQGAIMESGGPTSRAVYPYNHPLHEAQFNEFLALTGTADIPDESKMTHLRSIDIETIVAASETVFQRYSPSLRWPFQPSIDGPGGMIPSTPISSWKARAYHKVPIITGFNTNEGTIFIDNAVDESKDFDDFFKTLIPNLTDDDIKELNTLYPDPLKPDPLKPDESLESKYTEDRPGLGKQYKRLARAYGDFAYIAPVRHTAHFASAMDLPDDAAVWMYQFDVNGSVVNGAAHGDQGMYIVNSPDVRNLQWSRQGAIAEQMHSYWTSFVISGDVNEVKKGKCKNRSTWARYGKRGSSAKMVFGEHNNQRAGGESEGALTENRPDLWGDAEGDFWWARTELSESI